MHVVRKSIQAKKTQEHNISKAIGVVETRMRKTGAELERVDSQLEVLDLQHTIVADRLLQTRDRLAQEKQALSRRIRSNYQHREATPLDVLLNARSTHELLSRAYLVRLIVKSDADLIKGIRQDIAAIEADERLLAAQERQQERSAAELEARKRSYANDVVARRKLLQNVHAERAHEEQQLDDLESAANEMTGRIRALEEMLRRREEAARRAEIAARKRGHKSHARTGNLFQPLVWRGRFSRPCSGAITSGFGMRFHPILHRNRMHTGVDFGAGTGSPIRAAAGGIVLLSAYNRGYGNCIILYHGSGVSTLYGHCSARMVREGQTVSQGELIGRVGATGLATGPHLHFEVRRNGVPVAPY
jgi:murein DD-endopeptidase MepM/ murein hydrolase activator NlpD